jgi:hypothetical protein
MEWKYQLGGGKLNVNCERLRASVLRPGWRNGESRDEEMGRYQVNLELLLKMYFKIIQMQEVLSFASFLNSRVREHERT